MAESYIRALRKHRKKKMPVKFQWRYQINYKVEIKLQGNKNSLRKREMKVLETN